MKNWQPAVALHCVPQVLGVMPASSVLAVCTGFSMSPVPAGSPLMSKPRRQKKPLPTLLAAVAGAGSRTANGQILPVRHGKGVACAAHYARCQTAGVPEVLHRAAMRCCVHKQLVTWECNQLARRVCRNMNAHADVPLAASWSATFTLTQLAAIRI